MALFGSRDGAKAFVRNINIGTSNAPTDAQMDAWLAARSAEIVGWLAAANYDPATVAANAEAYAVLSNYANKGAAGDAELTQAYNGYDDDDPKRRDVAFLAEFRRARDWIQSGALAALGIATQPPPDTTPPSVTAAVGLLSAGRDYVVRRW